jgi:DNA polymerase-3 subunit alpha
VIVYQDQVLKAVQALAGFSLGKADILRRAMGKKKPDEMRRMRAEFVEGARAKGIDEDEANRLFDLIEPFAGYAFNKAHAVCYAHVAYQTAYLKANYPVEYMAALMAVFKDKTDKVTAFIDECQTMGIRVLPPDINQSHAGFTVEPLRESPARGARGRRRAQAPAYDHAIRFGLGAIKGVGEAAVEAILREREANGAFADIFDFAARMQESGALNRATLEALIQAGAFESLHPNRAQLLNGLDLVLGYAQSIARAKAAGQNSLFEGGGQDEVAVAKPALMLVDDLPTPQKLALERELLGVYLSDHPMCPYQRVLAGKATPIAQAMEREGATLTIGGIITSVQTRVSKKTGARMAILQVEDLTGAIRVAVFANTYEQYRDAIQKDRVVLIRGKMQSSEYGNRNGEGNGAMEFRAEAIELAPEPSAVSEEPRVSIRLARCRADQIRLLRQIIERYTGEAVVRVQVPINGHMRVIESSLRVAPTPEVLQMLRYTLPNAQIEATPLEC